jgi:hypothetical protein
MLERLVVGIKVIRILDVTASDWALVKDVGRVSIAAVVAAVVALAARAATGAAPAVVTLAATGLTFSLAYVVALLALKIPTHEEIEQIQRQLERFGLPVSLRLTALAARSVSGT